MRCLFVLILLSLVGFTSQAQIVLDGFYKGKGNFDVGVGATYEIAKEFYAGTNKVGLARDILSVSGFLSYGITDRLDAFVSVPYIKINSVQNFQDGSLHLKYKLLHKEFGNLDISFSPGIGIFQPLSNYQTEGLNGLGQQAKAFAYRGIIHVTYMEGVFLTLQSGYTQKSEPTPSSMPIFAKIGFAHGKFYVDAWYEYQKSFGGLDYRGTPSPSTFKELGVDYNRIGLTFYKPFGSRFGSYASFIKVLNGRNTGAATGFSLGVVYKYFKK